MTSKDTLIAWLNNAHAMEKDLAHMLQQHAIDADLHPDVQIRLQEHLHQTQHHAELLEGCIERLGGSTSATKSALGAVMGSLGSALTTTAKDKLVKNMLMDYAAEHFEIAAYTSLVTAAEEVGDPDTAEVCRRILQEEQEMAEWCAQKVPVATREHLGRLGRT